MSGTAPVTAPRLEALDAPAHIRRVTLNVRDPGAMASFYEKVLGLSRLPSSATAVELGAADGEPLIRLAHVPGLREAAADSPGLFHTAFLLPSRRDLANWTAHAGLHGVHIEGASDHLVSEALYLSDPEGNGIEIYADRRRAEWPRDAGMIKMATLPLDGASLMAERDAGAGPWRMPAGARIGHIHLKVGDLSAAEAFYVETLHMQVMARYPGASFMSWGGYHHHVAVNVWHSRHAAKPAPGAAGLAGFEIAAGQAGAPPAQMPASGEDPSGNSFTVSLS